jgi:hypothetical protein
VNCSYARDHTFGIRHRAVRRQRDVPAGALEAPPEISVEAPMLNDGMQRDRVQRLQQQSADAPNEHRGIGMYPPDDIPLAKPSLAFSPDLGVLCLEVPGKPLPHSFGN